MVKLLVVGYVKNNRFYMMCLNTDILVVADSYEEAKKKMMDAIASYFLTFKHEEILAGKYKRSAPSKYWLRYYLAAIRISLMNFSKLNIKYNVNEDRLSFA